MRLILVRTSDNGHQTTGRLIVLGKSDTIAAFSCLEPAWENNQRNISCIPAGRYVVKKRHHEKFGNHFHVLDVPGRDYILIHAGNYRKNTSGCILPGSGFSDINKDGQIDITQSKTAMAALNKLLPDSFILDVVDHVQNL